MELMDIIFNALPDNIATDKVVCILRDAIKKYLRKYKADLSNFITFRVSNDIYSSEDFSQLDIKKRCSICEDDKSHLYTIFSCGPYILDVRIKGDGENYTFCLNINLPSSEETIKLEYNANGKNSKLEKTVEKKDSEYYVDYSYDAKIYSSGRYCRSATEEEKNLHFAEFFGVPKNLAPLYRKNFTQYSEDINKYLSLSFQNFTDDAAENDWNFIRFDSFDGFIDYLKDLCLYGKKAERVEEIKNVFSSVLNSPNISFAISQNTLNNIEFYIMNFSVLVYTRGLLILKEEDHYSAYYIVLDSETFAFSPVQLDEKNIIKMYSSALNADNDEFKKYL